MILCEPFTVFQKKKKKKQSTHNIKERKNRNRVLTMVEEQWWSFNVICTHNRNRALTTR